MKNDARTPSLRGNPGEPILIALSVLSACSRPPPPAMERPPSPVTVATAVQQDVPLYLDELGKCVARETVSILPQVGGRITKVHFTDGADLEAGDLLFTIDPRPFEVKLAAAQAALAQSEAALALAKQELARIDSVADPRAVSQQDRDVRKNAVDVADAQVQSGKAAVDAALLDLDYCSIRSPIDGRAGRRLVDAGNVVTTLPPVPLLVVQRLDPIYADFTIAEGDLSSVQRNMAGGTLEVEVRLPDEPDAPVTGELTFLDNAVQETSGTVRLRATIANTNRRFWPGRFVKVRLVLKTIENAVLVPAGAPQMSARGQFVYVVSGDSTAEMRPVTTGQRQGDLVVVEQGVAAGERIVVSGQMGVMPGAKVRVVESGAEETGAGKRSAVPEAPASTGSPAKAPATSPAKASASAPARPPSKSGS